MPAIVFLFAGMARSYKRWQCSIFRLNPFLLIMRRPFVRGLALIPRLSP